MSESQPVLPEIVTKVPGDDKHGYARLSQYLIVLLVALALPQLCSCLAVDAAKGAVKLTGKAAIATAKLTGKAAVATGKAGFAGVKYATGRRTVKLEKEGNSYYAEVRINKKHKAKLLLDTGATNVQISAWMARKLGLSLSRAEKVTVSLADGSTNTARIVTLKELRVGKAKTKKVKALVIEGASIPERGGLLGMSFLNRYKFQIDTEKHLLILRATN
ncbi:MAG: retropepsin-like aspartic protease [Planctomycetota bacterium]|jgi:clan AA aspartic protease (TIGR02281 family)|nr:retropepsin-like aspartic protease [Planctomycetota bacterium]MDP7252791.1 retropepsin-like aspartic protease [Planctomycetota bacterium]